MVRETARQGLVGQVGTASVGAWPTSMIRADAAAGASASRAAAMSRAFRGIPAFNTTNGPEVAGRGPARVGPGLDRQILVTLTALGPLSPFSSS